MKNPALNYLISFFLFVTCTTVYPELIKASSSFPSAIQQKSPDKKVLLNGRIWRNQYPKAEGNQFFLSETFLKGSVTYNGRRFNNLDLQYDLINDELILRIESYPVIMMNKEMVDSFCLAFENRLYQMVNTGTETSGILKGYVNVLYDGPTALYVKYTKKILPLAVNGRYDLFIQEHNIYVKLGAEIVPVTGKGKLLNLLNVKKKEIRSYLGSNRFKVIKKDPATFIPVLRYYDSLGK